MATTANLGRIFSKLFSKLIPITLLFAPFHTNGQPIPEDLYFSTVTAINPSSVNSQYQDSKGFFWILTSGGLFRIDGASVKEYKSDPRDLNSLSTSGVVYMTEDLQGKLWISTRTRGINSFDPFQEKFEHYYFDPDDSTTISNNNPRHITTDEDGMLWIGFSDENGLNHFDPIKGMSKRYKICPRCPGRLQGKVTGDIVVAGSRVYLGTSAGLEYYDKADDTFHYIPLMDENQDTIPYQLFPVIVSQDGSVWTGLPGPGLRRYDPRTGKTEIFPMPTTDNSNRKKVNDMVEDADGRIWFIYDLKLWSLSPDRRHFQKHRMVSLETSNPINSIINALYIDHYGLLWVNQFFFDPRQNLFNHHQIYSPETGEPLPIEKAEMLNDSTLFVRSITGFFFYNLNNRRSSKLSIPPTRPLREAEINPEDPSWLVFHRGNRLFFHRSGDDFFSLEFQKDGAPFIIPLMYQAFDKNGDLWLATWGQGVIRIRREVWENADGPIDGFDQWTINSPDFKLPTNHFLWVSVDHQNRIWLSCNDGGLLKIDKENMQIQQYDFIQGAENTISATYVMQAFEGPDQQIWCTTDNGGLNKFNPVTGQFHIYDQTNGLLNQMLFQAAFDGEGKLWFNNRKGISNFDPNTTRFTHYDKSDGLRNWQNHLRYYAAEDLLITTGPEGFHTVQLRQLKNRPVKDSPLKIVEILSFAPGEDDPKVHLPAEWQSDYLVLPYNENTLSIRFELLDYRSPEKHEYQYALSSDGKLNWIFLRNRNQLNLTELRPGSYQLQLRGRNSDGIWTTMETPLNLYITPPLWQTPWAYLLYVLLISGGIYYFYRMSLLRQVSRAETRQLKELDNIKTRFFTNITHEFRTPLTVILGVNEQAPNSQTKELIRRNARKLLILVNQLLDLAKLNANNLKPDYQQIEIIAFIRYLSESFRSLAAQKDIELTHQFDIPELWMDMDKQMLQQILSNLLSNALKFTRPGGRVGLRMARQEKHLLFLVEDNGIGIPSDELPRIFDRFYQVDTPASREGKGTGIGLALTRELVQLLDGQIEVTSAEGTGTVFRLQFPIRQTAIRQVTLTELPTEHRSPSEPKPTPTAPSDTELPQLLLIEDNQDVVTYIRSVLHKSYLIQRAADGEAGIKLAIENIPDLIISDIMMPRKNGYEVVKTLKRDERTNHIPIILLTAKSTFDDRMEGLKYGADAYLQKPFVEQELKLVLENRLELRRNLQKRYRQLSITKVEDNQTPEDHFLQKVRHLVKADLQKNWTVGDLAASCHLSESQFYRKIKALTGIPPNHLVRQIRLEHAAQLLSQDSRKISDVAYSAGFSDPNFFSRQFSETFGVSPSAYREGTSHPPAR